MFVKTETRKPTLDKNKVLKEKPIYRFFKRVQDIFYSVFALIVLAVPMLILAIVIYMTVRELRPFLNKSVLD